MKKILFMLLLSSKFLTAQNLTFVYELKFKSNSANENLTTAMYYLDRSEKQSVFRSEQARLSDSLKEKIGYKSVEKMTYDQLYIVKNKGNKEVIKNITTPMMNDEFFLTIEDQLVWEVLPEKSKMGEMECQKATLKYGGRNWIAWFDPKIPVQDGPYVFNGLPGLIVKISDDKGDYDFSLAEIKNHNGNKMFNLRKGKEISWENYNKLQKDYYSDPFSEIKSKGMKYKVADENGNPVDMNLKQLTENIQKQMRENNNPIELNHKIEY